MDFELEVMLLGKGMKQKLFRKAVLGQIPTLLSISHTTIQFLAMLT
jgi:hypothetical protein